MLQRANNGKKESDGGRESIRHFFVAHMSWQRTTGQELSSVAEWFLIIDNASESQQWEERE